MYIPNLRQWRELRGLTQQELADHAGLSVRGVAGYEAGAPTRPHTARKLAEALSVDVMDLAGVDAIPKEQSAPPSNQLPLFKGGSEQERRAFEALEAHLNRLEAALNGGSMGEIELMVQRYIIDLTGPMVLALSKENPENARRFVELGHRVLEASRQSGADEATEAIVFDLESYRDRKAG